MIFKQDSLPELQIRNQIPHLETISKGKMSSLKTRASFLPVPLGIFRNAILFYRAAWCVLSYNHSEPFAPSIWFDLAHHRPLRTGSLEDKLREESLFSANQTLRS
jgi:hypothetical protein